ncbi:STAS domain-containing protein [Streptacidiphilus sp. PAMC 29251]
MGHTSPLVLAVLEECSSAQILVSGDLDLHTAPKFTAAVDDVLAEPRVRRIEVDAVLVDFCDASGLSALLQAHQQAARHGVALQLVRASAPLRRVLDLTGLWEPLAAAVPWQGSSGS